MENWEKVLEELFTGVMGMSDPTVWVMFAIGAVLIWLGVKKDYEPMLLFPMGVGCILANIPGHFAVIPTDGGEPGFLSVLYQAGIANELFPVLIFIAVGAMCEFDALIRAPYVMLFAAAAHFGIFAATMLASVVGFPFNEAASIGIIGGSGWSDHYFRRAEICDESSRAPDRDGLLLYVTCPDHSASDREALDDEA